MEGRALGKLLARAFYPEVAVILDACAELLDQARFSDPRLAHHEHDLSRPSHKIVLVLWLLGVV
jgi:hypothetical protein